MGRALFLLLLLPTVALAGPRFAADDADLGGLASRMWDAGVACTGWEPRTHDVVPIDTSDLDWAEGRATVDATGLEAILLAPRHPADHVGGGALAHEIAHAWAHSRSSALSEGVAQVLAECIAGRLGLHAGTAPSLPPEVPDLRRWSPDRARDDERSAGYELSRRLAKARVALFGQDSVWGPSAPTHLDALRKDLVARGPRGRFLDALLDRPAELRAFLVDRDHDDVPDGVERLLGSDPDAWDSDGDGWWDGALARVGVPLPADRSLLCLPAAAGWRLEDGPTTWTKTLEALDGDVWRAWEPVDGVLPPARVVRRGAVGDWWSGWGGRGGSRLVPVGGLGTDEAPCPEAAGRWVAVGEDFVRVTPTPGDASG